jgi:elongator complex protein 1
MGRHGRHDVVFFERNGLRRLEFDGQWIKQGGPTSKEDPWSYVVKDMSWSCDSNILAIWISRKGIDVCA